MTILPKKKPSKDKKEVSDNVERPPHSPGGAASENRGSARHGPMPGSPGAGPPRWGSPPLLDHDRLPNLDASFADAAVAGGHSSSVTTNKRRLRDRSPTSHRNSRKQRHDSTRGGLVMAQTSNGPHCYQRLQTMRFGSGQVGDPRAGTSQSGFHVGGVGGSGQEELNSGYNSEDETEPQPRDPNIEEKERVFEQTLKEKRGFIIKRMGEDGACLFRAIADQVYGDQEMHSLVRQLCVDYMAKNCDFFMHYVTEDFTSYLNRKRLDHCHGNHIEMQALCELYNRPIEVYQLSIDPINVFHGAYKTDNEPIRLSYHGNVHYNSVVDPRKATVGVGLGLPGLQPGLADKNLMRDAIRQSEDCHIEQTMLEDKLRETDWELTQETIEEQVARESYLQWLQEQDKLAKMSRTSPRSACASCSTATESVAPPSSWWDRAISPEPRCSRSPRSPQLPAAAATSSSSLPTAGAPLSPSMPACAASTSREDTRSQTPELPGAVGGCAVPSTSFSETTSIMNELPPQLFGFDDYDYDDNVLARVIAESQQEYLASLKKNVHTVTTSESDEAPPAAASAAMNSDIHVEHVPCSSSSSGSGLSDGGKGKSIMPKDIRH